MQKPSYTVCDKCYINQFNKQGCASEIKKCLICNMTTCKNIYKAQCKCYTCWFIGNNCYENGMCHYCYKSIFGEFPK